MTALLIGAIAFQLFGSFGNGVAFLRIHCIKIKKKATSVAEDRFNKLIINNYKLGNFPPLPSMQATGFY